MTRVGLFAVCALLPACGPTPGRDAPVTVAQPASELPFVGRTWLAADPAAAPGTIRIFLPDGTLVMTSCVETYRLAEWRSVGTGRIEWQEDLAVIAADVTQPGEDELQLRLELAREVRTETYRSVAVPSVCPDLPR